MLDRGFLEREIKDSQAEYNIAVLALQTLVSRNDLSKPEIEEIFIATCNKVVESQKSIDYCKKQLEDIDQREIDGLSKGASTNENND